MNSSLGEPGQDSLSPRAESREVGQAEPAVGRPPLHLPGVERGLRADDSSGPVPTGRAFHGWWEPALLNDPFINATPLAHKY